MLRRAMLVLVMAACGAAALPERSAADADTASEFIQKLANKAIGALAASELSADRRESTFRELLNEGFDLPHIGQFVLGRYWHRATTGQRSEYLDAFAEYVLQTYSAHFSAYAGESLTVLSEREMGDGDILVQSRIDRPNGAPIAADWRVRRADGRFRVIDVMIEGVSMAVTQRSEFGSVVRHSGVEGLIQAIRERTGKPSRKTAASS